MKNTSQILHVKNNLSCLLNKMTTDPCTQGLHSLLHRLDETSHPGEIWFEVQKHQTSGCPAFKWMTNKLLQFVFYFPPFVLSFKPIKIDSGMELSRVAPLFKAAQKRMKTRGMRLMVTIVIVSELTISPVKILFLSSVSLYVTCI